jgi:hypothetical protein
MSMAMNQDGIVTPSSMSQNQGDYSATCEKFNQTIMILWRQKLPDQAMPSIPQDHGLPVCTVYGAYATLKLRGFQSLGLGVKEIVQSFYGERMKVEPTQSRNSSYNATMRREGENPVWSEEVAVQVATAENPPEVPGFNEALRESAEMVGHVDKVFQHYIKFFGGAERIVRARSNPLMGSRKGPYLLFRSPLQSRERFVSWPAQRSREEDDRSCGLVTQIEDEDSDELGRQGCSNLRKRGCQDPRLSRWAFAREYSSHIWSPVRGAKGICRCKVSMNVALDVEPVRSTNWASEPRIRVAYAPKHGISIIR